MKRILLIDDDTLFREMLKDILESLGHQVTEAREGSEGISLLRTINPDLVMTDLIMPGKEGIETIMELRRENPDLKIIAMSGGGRGIANSYLKIAQQMGAKRVLSKPFSIDELREAIEEAAAPSAASNTGSIVS